MMSKEQQDFGLMLMAMMNDHTAAKARREWKVIEAQRWIDNNCVAMDARVIWNDRRRIAAER